MGRKKSDDTTARIAEVRKFISAGVPMADIIEWCTLEITPALAAVLNDGTQPKDWKVSRQTARVYVDKALEGMATENALPRDRKQARNRATLTLIVQRLLENGSVSALNAAVTAMDKICRIDGSYDPTHAGPAGFQPATVEETQRLISHAYNTLQLAQRRGVMPLPAGPPVVDASSVEVANDDEDEDTADARDGSGN